MTIRPHSLISRSPFMLRVFVLVLIVFTAVSQYGVFSGRQNIVEAGDIINRTGRISVSTAANVRAEATTTSTIVATLPNQHPVMVDLAVKGEFVNSFNTDIWYKITFTGVDGVSKSGYILSALVVLDLAPPDEPDKDFEALLDAEGFPESYRPMLRALNRDYPQWRFKALHTSMTWQEAVDGQARTGVSLIENFVNDNWKTTDPAGYDWLNDKWYIFDADRWVMTNKNVIAYYMDPRNMFNSASIFQFENLQYAPDVHNREGVVNILKNTFMEDPISYSYLEKETNVTKSIRYVDTFMKAAELSGVSPYHLASRVVQEVGTSGSNSVSGTYEPYVGYYNFFNIGAFSSSDPVANGLQYAKYGPRRREIDSAFTESDLAFIKLLRIPWDNRYDSIVGGGMFLGNNYVNRNQNTLYLQRFNLRATRYPSHQYMTNIRAVASEALRVARGYTTLNGIHNPIEFLIPVFKDMPAAQAPMPPASGNPNNWLKTLRINGSNVTPSFNPATREGYSFIVENNILAVEVSAVPVNANARVNAEKAGTFTKSFSLVPGDNVISLVVTAQNGSKRTYKVNVVRQPPEPTATPAPTVAPKPTAAPAPTKAPAPTATPAPPVPAELNSDVYAINEGIITGLDFNSQLNRTENLVKHLKVPQNHTMRIVDLAGKAAGEIVGTGYRVELLLADKVVSQYTIVIFGDTNGAGRISSADLNNVLNHVLRRKPMEGIYALAADVDQNGRISSADINHILNHVLRKSNISQTTVEAP